MKSSLIPEKPILLYPSLAATVGLDEAILLASLNDLARLKEGQQRNGYLWFEISLDAMTEALPFWDRRELQRVSTSLRDKGTIIIGSAPLLEADQFKFAFNEKSAASNARPATVSTAPAPPTRPKTQGASKNFIPHNWQPDSTTLEQLAQLNIPANFAREQVPEFVTYWLERNIAHRSWGQKFINHTLQRWRTFEERQQRRERATPIPAHWSPRQETMDDLHAQRIPRQFVLDQIGEFISYWQATGEAHLAWDTKFIQRVQTRWSDMEAKRNIANREFAIFDGWRPSQDALDIMINKTGIPQSFIDDTIPEFIIYWQEKGTASNTWNSLFIKHVRLQWHRYQHALDNNLEPQPITQNWQPSDDVYDILKMANIDVSFAQELVGEFVLYWRDRNELHRSWNSKFLQHVKRTWASRHAFATQNTDNNSPRSTREISLEEELNDTSWAN